MPRPTASPPARPRALLAALAAGVVLASAAAPAYAHDALRSSDPADGATLGAPPAQVVLTFEEPPVELGAQIVVTGPDGPVSSGSPRLAGVEATQTLKPGAPAGRYTVEWRVTSDDGHPVSGSFAFTAQAAAAGSTPSGAAASPSPAPADGPRRQPLIPSWAWIVLGLIVIAAAIRTNRRARDANRQQED